MATGRGVKKKNWVEQAAVSLPLLAFLCMWGPSAQAQAPTQIAARQENSDPTQALVQEIPGLLDMNIKTLPGLERLTLGDITGGNATLIKDFPGLKDLPLSSIPGINLSDLGISLGASKLSDITGLYRLNDPTGLGTLSLQGAIDLGALPSASLDKAIGSIPGLGNISLGQIPGIDGLNLGSIPGLGLTALVKLPLTCFTPQLVDHVNLDNGGFTEFAAPAQRYPVGKEIECGGLKIKHTSVDEVAGKGKFEFYVPGPFGSWIGGFPWPDAVENQTWLGPLGNESTLDTGKKVSFANPVPKPIDLQKAHTTKKGNSTPKKDSQGQTGKQQSIADAAKGSVGKYSTHDDPRSANGNVGCALAVNHVVKEATGKEIGGEASTTAMDVALRKGAGTRISESQAKAGDVIISPTSYQDGNRVTGHVGVCLDDGCSSIGSNSSSSGGLFKQNFTIESWHSTFDAKGLPVKIYQVK